MSIIWLKIPVSHQQFHSRYYMKAIHTLISVYWPVNCILTTSYPTVVNMMTNVTVCYRDILKVHGMSPIRKTKWHALSNTVIFIHQVSSIGCIRSACIVFQHIKLQSLEMYARQKSAKPKSGKITWLTEVQYKEQWAKLKWENKTLFK